MQIISCPIVISTVVASAGTPVPITTADARIRGVSKVIIKAKSTNTEDVYVGFRGSCSSTLYIKKIGADELYEIDEIVPEILFIDADVSGEGVNCFIFTIQ